MATADRALEDFSLKGRVALVTGSGGGIGRVIAAGFLSAGARVALCDRDEEKVREAEAELGGGGDVTGVVCDVSDAASVKAIRDLFMSRIPFGRAMEARELVGTAVYPASAAADFVTGQVLYVDGGSTAG